MSEMLAKTRYGMLEGTREGSVSIWKGIPYASPPVGSLRFRPPKPPEAWRGVRSAQRYGPSAMQSESVIMRALGDSPAQIDEDCLYLNIWSPGADHQRRPVLFWIHGGSFLYGSGSSYLYDGKFFAEQGNVVVVTINYRLGVFGFLHLGDLGEESYRASGNCGLLDQAAALRWVHENIEAFGGDPNNVTIFGESAGAVSVGCLMTMPEAKGLYHKAILQSGTARHKLTPDAATRVTEQLLARLQLDRSRLSELENIPAKTLLKAAGAFPRSAFGPVGDGVTIPNNPERSLKEGMAAPIPVLLGTNLDEWRLFTGFDPKWEWIRESEILPLAEQAFRPIWSKLRDHVIQERSWNRTLFEQAMTQYVFTYPAIAFAESHAKQGAPVWMYRFDYSATGYDGRLKACHALEIPFVWNSIQHPETVDLTGSDPHRYELARQMHLAWIAFAHRGNPNIAELPDWPNYDADSRTTMLFNTTNQTVNDPDRQSRKKWELVLSGE